MPMFNFYYNRQVLSLTTSASSGLLDIKIKTLALHYRTLILIKLKARLN